MRQRAQIDCVAGQLDLAPRPSPCGHCPVVSAEHSATTTGQVAQHTAPTKSSGEAAHEKR